MTQTRPPDPTRQALFPLGAAGVNPQPPNKSPEFPKAGRDAETRQELQVQCLTRRCPYKAPNLSDPPLVPHPDGEGGPRENCLYELLGAHPQNLRFEL